MIVVSIGDIISLVIGGLALVFLGALWIIGRIMKHREEKINKELEGMEEE